MIFNKVTKQAFVHPPKTGTHTTQAFLRSLGWKALPKPHALTQEFLNTYPNLDSYEIFGFLRDPLKRFESTVLYLKRPWIINRQFSSILLAGNTADSVESLSYEHVVNNFAEISSLLPVFFMPQSAWLNHPKVTVLNFENIESELRRISGNYSQPIEKLNVGTDFGRSVITPAVKEFVRQQYADDYRLWNTLNGA